MATSMLVNPWSMNPSNFRYDQRHYKKDSRFVMDLYTLTYDSHESLDCHGVVNNNKKNDREEIRKRLVDGYNNTRKSTKKSSLESRLQNSSNLQLCFMNEQSSDTELPINNCDISAEDEKLKSAAELKQGLNLAKNRARAHMISDQRNCVISAVIKESLSKVGVKLDNDRRRVSRHFLMRLNLAQLQVIVNDLHSYIEYLNESLVNLLLERDELHMAKDSMLVDIEDLKHVNRMSY
ncbi:schwannomin-interacting protein 1 isoform X2 [Acyrthosiphon pisum]|uniref:Schwannomin interacting protein 1 C-terminal domain-containing protein n=1 Tax=Acyrthosiphon pisum TaxID=7029 RepID=A0A8R2AC00_ACYPI|nr:schwannomin-interacting protein 1 isoform X2 [Acyrthosiphon pisum]|eukprot:XP_003247450.1 PREDICTED: schwannomin-interacting protein 1 isoform X2 [Acyrthosiphon pisum]